MDQRRSGGIRGDGIRLGWRSLVGALLVVVLLLHGFDRSFVVDGYTVSILGLLVVLALAGELESARVGGFEVKFRKALLARLEQEIDAVVAEEEFGEGPEGESEEDQPETDQAVSPADLRSVAMADPGAAVVAFFEELEEAVERLFQPLARQVDEGAPVGRKVDALARYGVITASEARIVLDLVALRNAYVHGRGVNPDEATRLVAVGARLLPSFSRARRMVARAFEEQVEQVLESVSGIRFERDPSSPRVREGALPRPDFLVTSPFQIVIEAKAVTEHSSLLKSSMRLEVVARQFPAAQRVLVVPWAARGLADHLEERAGFQVLALDHLKSWLEQRVADR
jgi:hypothetical protein